MTYGLCADTRFALCCAPDFDEFPERKDLMNLTKTTACLAALIPAMAVSHAFADEKDPYIWLEEVEGEQALAWVEQQNERSLGAIQAMPQYEEFFKKNLAVYDSDERIPYPSIQGEYLYNFWRDAKNERGIWRRTTPARMTGSM